MVIDRPARALSVTSPNGRQRKLGFERTGTVEAMKHSPIEMFGARALPVVKRQQGRHNVGADSWICWRDLLDALSKNAG